MHKSIIFTILFILTAGAFSAITAQTADTAMKPSLLMGDVASISPSKIVLNTKDGPVNVTLSARTEYKRVPPENPVLKAAVAAAFTDIGEGDKLVVTGLFGADKTTLPAKSVYLMTKSDIAQRHAKESEAWKTRGITGRVVSVNAATSQVTVETRTLTGSSTLTLTPKEQAKFLRYAPDSVKFDEAKASSIGEIKAGDMVRALGDKSADGTGFAAEEIVTGAFQTLAGTVKSIDTVKNEIVITNLQTKKDVTVAVGQSSILKRFPEEMATRMAAFQGGQGGGARPIGQGATSAAGGTPGQTPGGQGRGGFGGQRGGGNIDEMLDRFPNITAADLKVGDMIAVSSTKNGSVDRITAIKLLAGVEPFLRAAQASSGQGTSSGQSLNIPGLEGFGNP